MFVERFWQTAMKSNFIFCSPLCVWVLCIKLSNLFQKWRRRKGYCCGVKGKQLHTRMLMYKTSISGNAGDQTPYWYQSLYSGFVTWCVGYSLHAWPVLSARNTQYIVLNIFDSKCGQLNFPVCAWMLMMPSLPCSLSCLPSSAVIMINLL